MTRTLSGDLAAELDRVLKDAEPRLKALIDSAAGTTPAPGKWSAKEIVGHLIDSAANNHLRFVRAQLEDDLIFDGYAQDGWVSAQCYQEADWGELVRLWLAYNQHLVRIVAKVPEEVLTRKRPRHNLHRLAWRPVPESQPTTLEYFIRDYIGHARHHLAQVLD